METVRVRDVMRAVWDSIPQQKKENAAIALVMAVAIAAIVGGALMTHQWSALGASKGLGFGGLLLTSAGGATLVYSAAARLSQSEWIRKNLFPEVRNPPTVERVRQDGS